MTMAMLESIVGVSLLLMLLLILLVVFIACKPWRFFFFSSRSHTHKVGELDRPLVSDDLNPIREQINELGRDCDLEGACFQNEGSFQSPRTQVLVHKLRMPVAAPNLIHDILVGQTLKRPLVTHQIVEEQKHGRQSLENDKFQAFLPKDAFYQRSCLTLEVISGPSRGFRSFVHSSNNTKLPLNIGRVSPSDICLKDSEVSGKHAMINWNLNNMKWELVDMVSLNGTLLNCRPINHPETGSRRWGNPTELANGNIITFGTTSKVSVQITSQIDHEIPFGVGVASDPMALRLGGKMLPMEDVCYHHWPLPGVDKFGLFGICDGHGGAAAAISVSKILPKMVATLLSDSLIREKVLALHDASDVLRDAFSRTEACMNHHYEGCTATVLLVWTDGDDNIFAQCANVGDSACVVNVEGNQIKLTEDHRVTSHGERLRMEATGETLRDGETRLCGLGLARMLGGKFLKEQDARFSSEPYISQVVHIDRASKAFALLASDGFWDVISAKKAVQLVLQTREKSSADRENTADKIATYLLSEAKTLRTKDNTSVIFLDFDFNDRGSHVKLNLD